MIADPRLLLVLVGYHAWSCADEVDGRPCSFCEEVYGRAVA